MLRITADNQAILKRIQVRLALPDAPCLGGRVDLKAGSCAQERQPFYNHLEWERERLQNEKYLRSGNRAAHLCPWLWASARSSLTAGLLFAFLELVEGINDIVEARSDCTLFCLKLSKPCLEVRKKPA